MRGLRHFSIAAADALELGFVQLFTFIGRSSHVTVAAVSEGFTPGGALAIPPSKTNGYSGINLCFRRRVVEAKVETDIEEGMFVQPEIRAQIERVDRWRRPISPDRGKQLDNSVGALDTGNRMGNADEIDEVRFSVV